MTLIQDIEAVQERLRATHRAIVEENRRTADDFGTPNKAGNIHRTENDALWESIKLLATRLDAIGDPSHG